MRRYRRRPRGAAGERERRTARYARRLRSSAVGYAVCGGTAPGGAEPGGAAADARRAVVAARRTSRCAGGHAPPRHGADRWPRNDCGRGAVRRDDAGSPRRRHTHHGAAAAARGFACGASAATQRAAERHPCRRRGCRHDAAAVADGPDPGALGTAGATACSQRPAATRVPPGRGRRSATPAHLAEGCAAAPRRPGRRPRLTTRPSSHASRHHAASP